MSDEELDLAGLGDDDAWGAIVRAYGRAIPSRVAALEVALRAARTAGGRSSLEEPRRLAHRLYGTAGSYGFEAVGAAAGQLEAELIAAEGASAIDAATWSRIDDGAAQLRAAAAEAGDGEGAAGEVNDRHEH